MKRFLVLVTALAAAGCGQDQAPQVTDRSEVSGENTSYSIEHEAQAQMALITVNEAIQGFRLLEKRYPNDLAELVKGGPLSSLPSLPEGLGYTYDVDEGKAGVAKLSEDALAVAPAGEAKETAEVEEQPEPPGPIGMDEEIEAMLAKAEAELRASAADTEERMKAAEAEIRELVEAAAAEAEAKLKAEAEEQRAAEEEKDVELE